MSKLGGCCTGILKLTKELSDLGGGGWKGSKNLLDGGGGGMNGGGAGKPGPWPGPGGSAGGDGRGERSSVSSCLCFNLFNRFLREKLIPGGSGACFIRSLANVFPPTSSSPSREPTIGISESKVEIS